MTRRVCAVLAIAIVVLLVAAIAAHAKTVTWVCHVSGYQVAIVNGQVNTTTIEKCVVVHHRRRVWVPGSYTCVATASPNGGVAGTPVIAVSDCVWAPAHWKVVR